MAMERARLGVMLLLALSPAGAFGPEDRTPSRPIVIDAGHGGEDLGAVVRGCREKDVVLGVALRLRRRLEAQGIPDVRLTRESDEFVPLDLRTARAAAWDGSLFVSLHANKVFWKRLRGAAAYSYGKGKGRSDRRHRRLRRLSPLLPPPAETARAGAGLSDALTAGLRGEGLQAGAPERAEYYVLKNPRAPSALVELGFLSNPEEARLLADPAYQERLAAALADGILRYLNLGTPYSISRK